MGNYVYIYRNNFERFYIGRTDDVHRRMKEHRKDEWSYVNEISINHTIGSAYIWSCAN